MITAAQMRAARALAGIDQKTLAERAGVSLPTIQRMEASEGVVRGVVDTLVKVIQALDEAGVELIGENQSSERGGRGVRLKGYALSLKRSGKTALPDGVERPKHIGVLETLGIFGIHADFDEGPLELVRRGLGWIHIGDAGVLAHEVQDG